MFRAEYRMRRRDGQRRWILNPGSPSVTDAPDELAVRVAERTAELLRAKKALRKSGQPYLLTKPAPVGIFR